MEDLIPLINKLQSVFKTTGMDEIKLPQIVVVGAQSSGKSSVLESLVKKSFLPRGTGIVTRCPIILQLNQIKEISEKKGFEEWCRFSKTPEKTYTDFDEVRHAIEDLQVEMAGDKKGISMEPIILEVFSPNVIDLTVVDLPGIVKIALEGQPWDIEEQVHNLITNYINNESAIILAVSAANADIATSESIKIANKVDPNGNRTIAVVTKLDLMDKGTDAANVLTGEIIKVKLGIIGVINRSQQDINNNTSMEEALRKEEEILRKAYPQIHGIGSPYLAKRLNQILTDHIHQNLPALIRRIAALSEKCQRDLHSLGREISTDPKDCSWLIMEATLQFVKNFREIVHFRPIDVLDEDADLFAVSVNASFKKLREEIVTDENSIDTLQIMKALKNTQNFEGFASIEQVFKTIVKQQIMLMAAPAIHCAQDVHDLLSRTANKCFEDPRLKYLNRMIKGVVDELLDDQLKHTITGINEYIKLQTGMIFSSDEVFVRLLTEGPEPKNDEMEIAADGLINKALNSSASIVTAFPLITEHSVTQLSDHRVLYVHKLIMKYLEVVKRELSDYVPKYLMFQLADQTINKISEAIKMATIGKESHLVSEPEEIRLQRKHKQELLKNLRDAAKIIRDIK